MADCLRRGGARRILGRTYGGSGDAGDLSRVRARPWPLRRNRETRTRRAACCDQSCPPRGPGDALGCSSPSPSSEARDRWLTRKEAAALLRAARQEPKVRLHLPLFILMALYTGQRKDALLSLRWVQVDLA